MTPRVEVHQEPPHEDADGTDSSGGKRRAAAGVKFPPDVPAALLGKTPIDPIPKVAEPQQFHEQNLPNLPGVRYCQWFQFKNRYADEDLSDITIEALVGPSDISNDTTVDQYRRFLANKTETQQFPPGLADYQPPLNMAGAMLHRVRLHSPAVLKRLTLISQADSDWTRQPTTFFRPFAEFICYHDKMKAELARAETTAHEAPSLQKDYEELQEYINFVEQVILPLKAVWDPDAPKNPTKIRHSDLVYIFRPGELLYFKAKGSYGHGSGMPPDIRMHISTSFEILGTDDKTGTESFLDAWTKISVMVYRIDFDGRSFRPVMDSCNVRWFGGEAEVRSLECYPLRFENDAAKILAECQDYGRRFTNFCTGQPHWFHSGWTVAQIALGRLDVAPRYIPGQPPRQTDPVLNSEFIDSEVIIDFREAMKALRWSPHFMGLDNKARVATTSKTDMWNILTWADRRSTETKSAVTENLVIDCDLGTIEEIEMINRQPILSKGIAEVGEISDLQLALLPRRVLVYSLRDREFVGAHIDCLTKVRNEHGGFKNLRINGAHLRMIKSLVKNHFDTKKLEKQKGSEMTGQDFIHGKGRGVVVLLHGVPGVGKTATAEAVAQEYTKPLFPITCGDLGTTPEAVSKSLMNIFRLASLWGCVLLLDEADVFLSRREQKGDDLMRNALVSVFLRVLEYYNGILFLTTNRPGTLDEAVKSRVHASFFYPHLNWEQTRDIFKLNIERLRRIEDQRAEAGGKRLVILENQIMRFSEDHFYTHTDHEGRWNGRQIRNAFQIAAGLAHLDGDGEDGEQDPDAQKQLGKLQFQEVAEAIINYDRFRAKVLGKYDDEIARERMERPVKFEGNSGPQDPTRSAGYRGSGGGGGGGGGRMRDRDEYPAGRGGDYRNYERYNNYDDGPSSGSGGGYGRQQGQYAQRPRDWGTPPEDPKRRSREMELGEEYVSQRRFAPERSPRAPTDRYLSEDTLPRMAGDVSLPGGGGYAADFTTMPRDHGLHAASYGSQKDEPTQGNDYR